MGWQVFSFRGENVGNLTSCAGGSFAEQLRQSAVKESKDWQNRQEPSQSITLHRPRFGSCEARNNKFGRPPPLQGNVTLVITRTDS